MSTEPVPNALPPERDARAPACPPDPPPFWTEVVGYLPELVRTGPTLVGIYVGPNRMAPALREKVILAVSLANRCAICSTAHGAIGRLNGLTDDDMHALANEDYARYEEHEQAAYRYAVHLARWRRVENPRYARELAEHWSSVSIRQIHALARLFTWTNRVNRAVEALARRLRARIKRRSTDAPAPSA